MDLISGIQGRNGIRARSALWMAAVLGLGLALSACQRKTPEDILREAYEMSMKGDVLGAEMKYEKLLEKNTDPQITMAAHAGLAMCYMSEGEYERGREQLDQVIKTMGPQHPDAIQFYAAKIDSYFREKKPEKAIELAEATSATLHGAPEMVRKNFRINLTDFYMTAKQEDKATQTAHQTIREWPDDPDLHIAALERIIMIPHQKQQWAKAIGIYEDYLKDHPNTVKKPELLFGIGSYHKLLGNQAKADENFNASEAELHKQIQAAMGVEAKGELTLKLARVQQGRGNTTSATTNLRRVIKDFPGSDSQVFAKFMLSEIALADKNTSEAIGLLTQVIKDRPETNFAYNAMGRIQQIQQEMMRPTTATLNRAGGTTGTLAGAGATTGTLPEGVKDSRTMMNETMHGDALKQATEAKPEPVKTESAPTTATAAGQPKP